MKLYYIATIIIAMIIYGCNGCDEIYEETDMIGGYTDKGNDVWSGNGNPSAGKVDDPNMNSEICNGDWQSAVEVTGIELDNNTLSALYTILKNDGAPGLQYEEANFIKYENPYKDYAYFALSSGNLSSRILVISRCPVYNLGQIRRLDATLIEMASYYGRAKVGNVDLTRIIVSREGRNYYSQNEGNYSRAYIQTAIEGGYINVPSNTASVAFGVTTTYNESGINDLFIDGKNVVHYKSSNYSYDIYFVSELSYGVHSFGINWYCDPIACLYLPDKSRIYFWDAAGKDKRDPLSVTLGQGTLAPSIHSLAISSVEIPKSK